MIGIPTYIEGLSIKVLVTSLSNLTPINNPIKKKVLAGVGKPVKYLVEGRKLKIASRNALPIRIRNEGIYIAQWSTGETKVYK